MERYRSIALVVLGVAIATIVDAAPAHTVLPMDDSAWCDDPPGLPEGARFAVISGHPAKAESFIMRVELPPGYKISSYRRPRDENIIVLNGAIDSVGDAHLRRTPCGRSSLDHSSVCLRTNGAILQRKPVRRCRSSEWARSRWRSQQLM